MNERILAMARRPCALRVEVAARLLDAARSAEGAERQRAEHHSGCQQAEIREWHEGSSRAIDSGRSAWLTASIEAGAGILRALQTAEQAAELALREHTRAVLKRQVVAKVLSQVVELRRKREMQGEQAECDDRARTRRYMVEHTGFADGWPTV